MFRRFALVLLPLALLAAACTGGGDGTDDSSQAGQTPEPTATVDDTDDGSPAGETPQPTTASRGTDTDGGAGGIGGDLFSTVNPFQLFMGSMGDQPISQQVDASLQAALLQAGDLPAGFLPMGEFTYSVPSEFGDMEMAASMFTSGDLASEDFGPMVMSAVLVVPPDALAEMGDLSELEDLTQADLDAMRTETDELGVVFSELRLLDASGLGDGGLGMHMAMDFGELFGAFAMPEEENPVADGIAMDMYIFFRGERALMVMVMWPTGQSSGVDARDLAETMDARAASSF